MKCMSIGECISDYIYLRKLLYEINTITKSTYIYKLRISKSKRDSIFAKDIDLSESCDSLGSLLLATYFSSVLLFILRLSLYGLCMITSVIR